MSQAEAEQVFATKQTLVSEDVNHSQAEPRYQALGETLAGRILHVSFTLRTSGTLIRVISARDASRKERAEYERQT